MASLLWQPGAFAERYRDTAARFGQAHALEASAIGELYKTAGVAGLGAIEQGTYSERVYPVDGGPSKLICCDGEECAKTDASDTCCERGTCCCDVGEDAFEELYAEASSALDNAHALQAAIRDILADPSVEDVGAAVSQALRLARSGTLVLYYVPEPPAKLLPDGTEGPARCPICGVAVCPTCGCSCECADSAYEELGDEASEE